MARLRRISLVSLATTGSRILGLVRDLCMFALLGNGPVTAAFILAFTLPNLFRRLLGEGALTSAVVPVLSRALEHDGSAAHDALLNAVLRRLLVVLTGLAGLLALGWLALPHIPGLEERWYLSSGFGVFLTPYLVLICLAAILSAALNVRERFLVAALSQVWLNLSMIVALGGLGLWLAETPEGRAWWLCGGVVVGGVFQWLTPWLDLRKAGWDRRAGRGERIDLAPVWKLFLPAVFAASIFQINILVSRLLAFHLDDTSTGALYLANRLTELPLGVFATAVSTVLFPELARFASREETWAQFAEAYHHGWRLIMLITVPAGVGLGLLAGPILHTLFAWGRFGEGDVVATALPLTLLSLAVPFYAWSTLATRAFHARQDMTTPVRLAMLNLVTNAGLSLLFMGPYGAAGLALANLLTAVLQCSLMAFLLRRHQVPLFTATSLATGLRILVAAAVMAALLLAGAWAAETGPLQQGLSSLPDKLVSLVQIVVLIPGGVLAYFATLFALREGELQPLVALVRRKLGR